MTTRYASDPYLGHVFVSYLKMCVVSGRKPPPNVVRDLNYMLSGGEVEWSHVANALLCTAKLGCLQDLAQCTAVYRLLLHVRR